MGAKLELIEIIRPVPGRTDFATAGATRPAAEGVDQDGWAQADSTLLLSAPASPSRLELELEYPGGGVAPDGNAVRISVDGAQAGAFPLRYGVNRITIDLPAGPVTRRLRLHGAKAWRLPAPDGRLRAFRILSVAPLSAGSSR